MVVGLLVCLVESHWFGLLDGWPAAWSVCYETNSLAVTYSLAYDKINGWTIGWLVGLLPFLIGKPTLPN